MKTKTTSVSNSDAELEAAPAGLTASEQFLVLQGQLDRAFAEIESLRDSLAIAHGYIRRMGECPGLKLF
jgi:hypothetical protein